LSAALSYMETQHTSDMLNIIQGCVEGSRVSQEKLYKMMYPSMMSMVKRYTNQYQYHIAEEILNNGFLKVFQKVASYKHEGSFEGWVRRVIYNSIFDYIRANIKYMEKVVFIEKDEVVDRDFTSRMNYNEIMKLVQELPDSTRTVFNMYVMEGFSHKEIADELSISEGTSKWHLFEARKVLKIKIEKLN
jgi:RNA polymerase sigma-70 factor (ECF subfamily)